METGAELIAKEYGEMRNKHGYTVQQDVHYNKGGQLRQAAVALICDHGSGDISNLPNGWNDTLCRHMMEKTYKERLIIAGALIAAEIDRIQTEAKS